MFGTLLNLKGISVPKLDSGRSRSGLDFASLQSRRFLRMLVENRVRKPFWKQLKMGGGRGQGRGREREKNACRRSL